MSFMCLYLLLHLIFMYMYIILGSVFVGLKDAVFEHSTPFRHVYELHQILQTTSFTKPVLFYTRTVDQIIS